jgi:sigma-B regulation protein RsbU (phosphoserine phosphatase)
VLASRSPLRSPVRANPLLSSDLLAELLAIVAEINAVLEPDELLPTIADRLRRIVDYRILDIFLPEKDGSLRPALVLGYDKQLAARFRIRPGEGIVGAAAKQREPVFVPDVAKDPRYIALFPGVVAELAIPLVHRDKLVGVLNIEGPDVAAFTPDAQNALKLLASHIAVAIDNATLYRETRWYAGLLATLHEIGKETASILELDALLHRVAEIVKRVIDYEVFGILLLDPAADELVMRKAVRFGGAGEKRRIKLGQGLCGTAALLKQPILVSDVRNDPRYVQWVEETRSELVVPLVHKDKLVGVFDLESPVVDHFTEEHVKILTPLASQVAGAIENARLYDELKRRDARVKRELRIAQEIQRGLFPEEAPRGVRYEASAHFRPAEELGGDLYDFYNLGENEFALAIGDVSGKGVPAALYGAFASGSARARAFHEKVPAEVLYRVNRTLRRRGVLGLFCALTYALFDFAEARVRLASSGLPYPLHYGARSRRCRLIEVPGLPLGTFDDSRYEEQSLALERGDLFVFHTDGVSEAHNGRQAYGMSRLIGLVEKEPAGSALELGERILSDLAGFMEGSQPSDDVTIVVVRIL